jgi:uncharacterized protein
MRQSWRNLTFLHAPVDPARVQALLPTGLTVETYEGQAWLGLVPFWMTGIRFTGFPAVPGTHTFAETNVRTYVTHEGRDPGVWFLSLDAANLLACAVAQRLYALPYHHARMKVTLGTQWEYASERNPESSVLRAARAFPTPLGAASLSVVTQLSSEVFEAQPGSFEFWLAERYLLYSLKDDRLIRGRVHHKPYPLRAATASVRQSMTHVAGIPVDGFSSVLASGGVDVDVFAVEPVQ